MRTLVTPRNSVASVPPETAANDPTSDPVLKVNSDLNLRVTEGLIATLRSWAKLKGYKTEMSKQSALFHLMVYKDDGSGRKPRFMPRIMELSGWHGDGKYGTSKLIHTLYADDMTLEGSGVDIIKDLVHNSRGLDYFASMEVRQRYISQVNHMPSLFGKFEALSLAKQGARQAAKKLAATKPTDSPSAKPTAHTVNPLASTSYKGDVGDWITTPRGPGQVVGLGKKPGYVRVKVGVAFQEIDGFRASMDRYPGGAKPEASYAAGDKVSVKYSDGVWYPAKIVKAGKKAGTWVIDWDEPGNPNALAPASHVKLRATRKKK